MVATRIHSADAKRNGFIVPVVRLTMRKVGCYGSKSIQEFRHESDSVVIHVVCVTHKHYCVWEQST